MKGREEAVPREMADLDKWALDTLMEAFLVA
jgi:hypothetical protein